MNLDLKYWGKSGAVAQGGAWALSFAPNLARPKVFFDQQLKNPLRFREAISALHEVVVGDFRFKQKDRTAYAAWKALDDQRMADIRRAHFDKDYQAELQRRVNKPVPPDLEPRFRAMHQLYWTARRRWASELASNDPELFRALVPCDPVVTVAPDVVFFECFAKDESSYGCLFVDRDAFLGSGDAGLGTTNVDYSLALFDQFQSLRTYRPTRLAVDPTGFEVKVEGAENYREEKIDLPPTWLRGFGQLQASMGLATRRVELSVDVVYSLLAHLKRHREKKGPRSLLFSLTPGKPPTVELEPFGVVLKSRGPAWDGAAPETIKVWGRRRLMVLSRLLPLADRVEVLLMGSGMPSIWVLHLGEMRFVLGLSGWTANDWTSGAALELLAGELRPEPAAMAAIEAFLVKERSATLSQLAERAGGVKATVLGSLHALAKQGQLVYDFARGLYRWRPVMPVALSEAVLGPEPEEVRTGIALSRSNAVRLTRTEALDRGRTLHQAKVDGMECEALFDLDGGFSAAKCGCRHFRSFRLRAGPCRHLLALRLVVNRTIISSPSAASFTPSYLH